MMLTESIKSSFETVLALEAKIKDLQAKAKVERENIQKFLQDNGETTIKQDGYYANLVEATRNTLLGDEVEKLLGYAIPDSCYKHTTYTTLKIKRMEMVG